MKCAQFDRILTFTTQSKEFKWIQINPKQILCCRPHKNRLPGWPRWVLRDYERRRK